METASLLTALPSAEPSLHPAERGTQPLALALLPSPLSRRRNRVVKRAVDLLAATVVLLFVFPWFLPLVAILIRLDSRGPVFFRQRRHRRNGAVFHCLKLRTMVPNRQADFLPAFENDHRITRVGRLLRATHLDELPQFFNVWTGDMSLVGPRPHMLSENERFAAEVEGYKLRQQVKPGITGLAQVRGLVGATCDPGAIERRLRSDLHYIRHWSPALDAAILWRTVTASFRKQKGEA